jgi:hypothetical protein
VVFFRDKPAGVLCKAQGVVHGFDFGFDVWRFGVGRNIVNKEFSPVPIDMRIRWSEGIGFSSEHRQVRYICSSWGCGVRCKH